MGFYHHHIFPRVLDLAMASPQLRRPRDRALAPARGRILEIGFGTGRNLTHYPPHVRRIEAIDPDFDLDRLSLPRIAHASIEVDFHHLTEDIGIVLGQMLREIAKKGGIARYGWCILPMDGSLARVALDFSGRGASYFSGSFPSEK